MGDSITLTAGAKVNPVLSILGRRPDGYHELETVLLGLDLRDRVTVSLRSGKSPTTVTTDGPFASPDIPTGSANLAAQGALAAAEVLGIEASFDIHVEKHIPSRAGLGGGSSDAAAAALGALILLGAGAQPTSPVEEGLTRALGAIGVDCAFFFGARSHGAALASGKGDQIVPIESCPDLDVLLITPSVDCPTPAVYGALGLAPGTDQGPRRAPLTEAAATALLAQAADHASPGFHNDLQPAALRAFPELRPWPQLLQAAAGPTFWLSGSGSTFFAVAPTGRGAAILQGVTDAAHSAGLSYRLAAVARPAGADLIR